MGDFGKAKANLPFSSNNIVNSYVGSEATSTPNPTCTVRIFSMSDLQAIAIVSSSVK